MNAAIQPVFRRMASALAGAAWLAFALAAPAQAQTSLVAPRAEPSGDSALSTPGPPGLPGSASSWAATDQTEVRLVSAAAAVGEAQVLLLGLEFTLKPGWKIYWRSPGAAGFPPMLDWSGSENLAGAAMAWPAPERFSVLGLDTLGYKDQVVFPLSARPAQPGLPLRLRLKVDYLTCSEICIPYTARLALDVPAGPAAATSFAHLIDRFENRVPGDGRAAGLTITRAVVTGPEARPALEVVAEAREPFERPDLFVEGPAQLDFAAPTVALSQGGHLATFRLGIGTVAAAFPDWPATALTLTLVDGPRAIEARVMPSAAPATAAWATLAAMLGLALLGGLILNLMPCVLPVLSLKLLGVVGHGGAGRRVIRLSFLASAAGVVFSFLALAGATIALKLAGHAVGWGLQFQEPAFLTALALVSVLFAANLWGLYEIRLPGFLADAAAGGGGGLLGHFLTGAFATVLATPCSAPFLGTAVGFALTRGPGEILAVFAALGLGLAMPYLLIAAAPGLVARLPRPGRWMAILKAVLGLALAGTAVWLVSVLIGELGLKAALLVGAALAAILPVLWARRRWPAYTRSSGIAGVLALAIIAFALPARLPAEAPPPSAAAAAGWEPFARAEIPRLVAAGRVVFVDVTADWCLTCKANKTLVLDRPPVVELLAAPIMVRMLADWTRPSDEIAAYLASYGRYGIPFNIVYGPGAPAGIPLPELLTQDAVRAALEQASGGKRAASE